jgi:hypothetical protein
MSNLAPAMSETQGVGSVERQIAAVRANSRVSASRRQEAISELD